METLINSIRPYTKTSIERIRAWIDALDYIDRDNVAGDVVEAGVWRAGNIILARKRSPARICWLYDTFTGMTVPGPLDVKRGGSPALVRYEAHREKNVPWAQVTVAEARKNLEDTGTLDDNLLRFVVGDVCKTLLEPANIPERIALMRLDTDWYASTKIELKVLYPRLVPGGVLIVDDYGHWMGARKAVDEYFGPDLKVDMIDYTALRIVKP